MGQALQGVPGAGLGDGLADRGRDPAGVGTAGAKGSQPALLEHADEYGRLEMPPAGAVVPA